MAGAGNDVNGSNAIRAGVAGIEGNAGRDRCDSEELAGVAESGGYRLTMPRGVPGLLGTVGSQLVLSSRDPDWLRLVIREFLTRDQSSRCQILH